MNSATMGTSEAFRIALPPFLTYSEPRFILLPDGEMGTSSRNRVRRRVEPKREFLLLNVICVGGLTV